MAVVVSQLVAEVSIRGADTAQANLKEVGTAATTLQDKLTTIKPYNAGNAITDVDVATAKLTLLESQVSAARDKLETLQGAADAGQSIKGIPEAEANLTLLEAKAQQARAGLVELQSGGQQAEAGLQDVETGAQEASNKLETLMTSAKETASSMAGNLLSSVKETAGGLAGGFFGGVKNAVGGLLDFGSKLGTTVFGLQNLYQGAVSVGKAFLEPNASMEQTQVAFTQLLGSSKAATAELKDLSSFAASTPFQFPELADATQKLLAFQIPLKDTKPLLTAIGDSLSGLGKNNAASLEQVVNVFGQMNSAGKIQTQDLMQLTSVGINGFQLLADQMHKPVATIKDMVTNGTIPATQGIEMLRAGMEKTFGGGMQAQSQTFNGLLSTFQDNISNAWKAFTGPMFDAAKNGLETMGNLVSSPAFQNFATGAGQAVANTFKTIGEVASKAFKSLPVQIFLASVQELGINLGILFKTAKDIADMLLGKFGISLSGTGKQAKELGDGALKGLTSLLKDVSNEVKNATQWLNKMDFSGITGGAKQAGDGFGGLSSSLLKLSPGVNLIQDFSRHSQDLAKWWQSSVVPAFKQAEPGFKNLGQALAGLMPVIEHIADVVHGVMQHAFDALLPVMEKAIPIIIKIAGILSDGLGSAIKFLTPYINQAIDAIGKFAKEIIDRVAPIVSQWLDNLNTNINNFMVVWKTVWPYVSQILKGVWDEIMGIVKIAWAIVSGIIKIGLDLLSGNWKQAWKDLQDMLKGVWEGIKQYLSGVWEIIKGIFSGAWAGIKAIFGPIGQWFHDRFNEVVNNVVNFKNSVVDHFNDLKNSAGNIFHGMINFIVDRLNDGISAVEGFVNNFGGGIDAVSEKLGAGDIIPTAHLPRIPHYASGTPDAGHPGGPAVVGERGRELVFLPKGTTVIPNGQTEKMLSMAGGKVPGYADGIGDIAGNIMNWLGGSAKSLLDNVLGALHIGAPSLPGVLNDMSSGVLSKLKDVAVKWIGDHMPHFSFGGSPVNASGDLKSWISAAMALTGVPSNWAGALATIAMNESGGDPNATNNWDSNAAAGDPSRGIMQTIGSTFAAYALPGHNNIFSPIDNISAGIGYIKARYGSVFNVPGIMSLASGGGYIGYANGGLITEPIAGIGLRTGTNYAFGERGSEMVIPHDALSSGGSSISNREILARLDRIATLLERGMSLDGQRLSSALMPYVASQIRYAVGTHGM